MAVLLAHIDSAAVARPEVRRIRRGHTLAARTAYTFFISLFENDCDRARMTAILRDMRGATNEQEIEAQESSG